MVLVATSVVLAGSSHEKVVDETVSWTLPANQCPEAPAGLTGSGERHMVVNTKVNADGSTQIVINDVVKGTATDLSGGGAYTFVYTNHSIELVPAGGGAHQISMNDNFVLNGKGNIQHEEVGFNWRWSYTPPEALWPPVHDWQKISTRGQPLVCDPI